MDFNPLIDGNEPLDFISVEKAMFSRKFGRYIPSEPLFLTRYIWDKDHKLQLREDSSGKELYFYDAEGRLVTCCQLDEKGRTRKREILEWDENNQLIKRMLDNTALAEKQIWTYEYTDNGRIRTQRCGENFQREKFSHDGLIVEQHIHSGNSAACINEYTYNQDKKLVRINSMQERGTRLYQINYSWNSDGTLESLNHRDFLNNHISDEYYSYEAMYGPIWLKRITWTPMGRRNNKKRPREILYRSLALKGGQPFAIPDRSIDFPNGVYSGQVEGNLPEGMGIFEYNNGSRYEGHFHRGVMDGRGKFLMADGRKLEGDFAGGVLEGFGYCTWPDGSSYKGHFLHGKMDGSGVFTQPDGTSFEGLFKDGQRTTHGIWKH